MENWVEKNLTIVIVCFSFFIFKIYWFSFFPEVVATTLGVLMGASITLAQIKGRQKLDENQKRKRVIESLLTEIKTHQEILNQGSPIRGVGDFMEALPTFSFDGITSSELYTYLPTELQKIVSSHYEGCHLNNYYVQAGILTNDPDLTTLQSVKIYIRKNIDEVLEKLEELSVCA